MSRFDIQEKGVLSGAPQTFISKYDKAIDWPNTGYTPDVYETKRHELGRPTFHSGVDPCHFMIHAPSQREMQLAFALAGVDYGDKEQSTPLTIHGCEGTAAESLALQEVCVELGRLCVDECPLEPDLIKKAPYRKCSRVTDECMKANPVLEKILPEIGLALLIQQGSTLPNS